MKPLKKILLLLHPELRQSTAQRLARELAERSGAQLHLLMAVHDPMIERADARVRPLARAQLLQQHSLWLDQLEAEWRNSGLQLSSEVLWSAHPETLAISRALSLQPDLLIADLHVRFEGESATPLSEANAADWQLARLCPVPLLLMRQDRTPLPRRIAAAVDVGTESGPPEKEPFTELIAKSALRLAIYSDAETHAVYAFPFRRPHRRPSLVVGISASLARLHREVHEQVVERFAQFARAYSLPEERMHWLEAHGEPDRALRQFVLDWHIDLLVLGAQGERGLEHLFPGAVAESLLRDPPCHLLLIKSPDFLQRLRQHLDLDGLRGLADACNVSAMAD